MPSHPALAAAVILAACAASCGADRSEEKSAVPLATATPDDQMKETDDSGYLDVTGLPPTKVLVDGKEVGTTPVSGLKIAPGNHDVTFVDEQSGNRTMTVTIEPGQGRTVTSNRPVNARDAKEKSDKADKGDKKKQDP
jgi:PEGA domain